ncbi:STAS domain-containing protein [Oceanobacillus rekensis]|uniref:STAS domain-containing protein n=1 Tax=Oceanobacillus rekensis TaxID=937927 RepID=UPI000B444337|nr:STAS domain-containing protein [Oceanobacillus rekensis]
MTPILRFSKYISEHTETLATEVVCAVMQKGQLVVSKREEERATHMYYDLFKFLGDSLLNDSDEVIPASLMEWSKKNSEMQLSSHGEISEIIRRYPPTREILNDIVTEMSIEFDLSVQENASIIKWINSMLDVSLNETLLYYKRLSNQLNEDTRKELLELSAPIVPIQDGIVIVPIIGDIDSDRAKHIMENVVPKISELDVTRVIVDFSGTLTINSDIANLFYQFGERLGLMGIHIAVTGIRPEIVQTIIHSGIDLSSVKSYATVKQALGKF